MSTPTVPVTVKLTLADGSPCVGVAVTAKLSATELYNSVVITPEVSEVTDGSGIAVLNLFPNAPAPTGLGTQGTTYRFTAYIDEMRRLDLKAQVPNSACTLQAIAQTGVVPALDAAEAAVLVAQAAAGAASVDADAAEVAAVLSGQHKTAAEAAATLSTTNKNTTVTKAGEATAAAAKAQQWAEQDNTPVEVVFNPEAGEIYLYSSKYHSYRAQAHAGVAATKEVLATQAADTATQKANEAGIAAGTAATRAGEAATSATLADQHKIAAETAAGTAGTKATEAGNSATLAGQHKTAAETAKSDAQASAAASLTSAQGVQTKVTEMEALKVSVQTSEQNALTYAAAAVLAQSGAEAARDLVEADRLEVIGHQNAAAGSATTAGNHAAAAAASAASLVNPLLEMATALINTQAIVVSHHGFA
jgi:hypothetical protein